MSAEERGEWEMERIQEAQDTGSPLILVRGLNSKCKAPENAQGSQLSLVTLTAQGISTISRYPSMNLDDSRLR